MTPDSFGRRLRAARHKRHLTQHALAIAIGTTVSLISRYEAGTHVPHDDRLIALARALGVDPGWLRYGERIGSLELHDGQWLDGIGEHSEREADAMVIYSTTPCMETGHVGWCWWARGAMGDAASLDEAKTAAERSLAMREGGGS